MKLLVLMQRLLVPCGSTTQAGVMWTGPIFILAKGKIVMKKIALK